MALAEEQHISLAQLLTGRPAAMMAMEFYLWQRYKLALRRLRQQAED